MEIHGIPQWPPIQVLTRLKPAYLPKIREGQIQYVQEWVPGGSPYIGLLIPQFSGLMIVQEERTLSWLQKLHRNLYAQGMLVAIMLIL